MGRTVYVTADVDLTDVFSEVDDDELMEEMESRGIDGLGDTPRELLTKIWYNRRMGKDYQVELDQLIYYGLGKVI
jgi:hypothetical protein